MFIWIFKRSLALGLLLGLAGCLAAPVVSKQDTAYAFGTQMITVANNSIVIAGPKGYCVDKSASRLRGHAAFVLLGGCAVLSGDDHDESPSFPGILTASVDQRGIGAATPETLDQLARFVTTEAGRAVLARNGQAGSVQVLGVLRDSNAVLIHLQDESGFQISGIEATYWRGLFELNGRLISASVLGFKEHPLPAREGLATLQAFLARIRKETPPMPTTTALRDTGVANAPIL
jgi:hypothetical protein